MAEKNPRRNETIDALFDAILSLETREECYDFFEDLCTVKEISDMAQRLEAAKLLLDGSTYEQAARLFERMSLAPEYPEFLTLPLYETMN
jgi:TrpR-related protein YerC/YecD